MRILLSPVPFCYVIEDLKQSKIKKNQLIVWERARNIQPVSPKSIKICLPHGNNTEILSKSIASNFDKNKEGKIYGHLSYSTQKKLSKNANIHIYF